MYKKIVFVGDKPAKNNIDPNIAFWGTKSYETLMGWVGTLQIPFFDVDMINSIDLIAYQYSDSIVIALGNEAEKMCQRLNVIHVKLPHPSGRNLKLNDDKWLKSELNKVRRWIHDDLQIYQ